MLLSTAVYLTVVSTTVYLLLFICHCIYCNVYPPLYLLLYINHCVCCVVYPLLYLPLYLLCCISAIVFAVVYLLLCICPCVSAPVNVYLDPVLYIWHCIRHCVSATVYISATVYMTLYIWHFVCCIVESDRVQRAIKLCIVQKWLSTKLSNGRIHAFICLRNLKFTGDDRVAPAVANGGWRVKICEWVYTIENTEVSTFLFTNIVLS